MAASSSIARNGSRHELGRVAEHIDRPGREMRRTDALGEHADARAALRQPRRRDQPGSPGADHDRVEVQLPLMPRPLAHGRCSTSSTPLEDPVVEPRLAQLVAVQDRPHALPALLEEVAQRLVGLLGA